MPSRPQWTDERGISMIELLVVILVVAVLTALAAGMFLEQRRRAEDRRAMESVRIVRLALEVHHHDHEAYAATRAELEDLEPTIRSFDGLRLVTSAGAYEVTMPSASGRDGGGPFTIRRAADGTIRRHCGKPGHGGCRAQPDAHGDSW